MEHTHEWGNVDVGNDVSAAELMILPNPDIRADKKWWPWEKAVEDLQRKINNSIPQKTKNQSKWALSVFVPCTLESTLFPVTFQDGGSAIPSDTNIWITGLCTSYKNAEDWMSVLTHLAL